MTLDELIGESSKRANNSWDEYGCYYRQVQYALERLRELEDYERVNPHINLELVNPKEEKVLRDIVKEVLEETKEEKLIIIPSKRKSRIVEQS